MSMKNPLTPDGIEPATFRFVAQHLNHCATVWSGYLEKYAGGGGGVNLEGDGRDLFCGHGIDKIYIEGSGGASRRFHEERIPQRNHIYFPSNTDIIPDYIHNW